MSFIVEFVLDSVWEMHIMFSSVLWILMIEIGQNDCQHNASTC